MMWCIEKKKLKSEKKVSKEEAELKGLDSQPMVIWIMSKYRFLSNLEN